MDEDDCRYRCRVCNFDITDNYYRLAEKHPDGNGVMRVVCMRCMALGFDPDGTIPPEVEY